MRERTGTIHRKGIAMEIGTIIRVIEVPATTPAETSPAQAPARKTEAPAPAEVPATPAGAA